MCGRYATVSPPSVLAEHFQVDEVRAEADGPIYNVGPTRDVPAVVARGGQRRLGLLRWGLVPSWAKDPSVGARMINARAESLLEGKGAFRTAFTKRRCLLPADGFFEWERLDDGTKQPWFIHGTDGRPLAFAGLWEVWRPKGSTSDDDWMRTCTIVTVDANALVAPIHDRMPLVLSRDRWDDWLDPDATDTGALAPLLATPGTAGLERYPVSTDVNNVRNDRPDLLEPAGTVVRVEADR